MRVVLTGATSFIGKAVERRLVSDGHEVVGFRHSFDEEPELLPERADIWLHLAWGGKGSEARSDKAFQDANVSMSLAALEEAGRLCCRKFVFAGSQAEYGAAQDGTLKKEYGAASPVSEYGRAKLAFGRLAAEKAAGDIDFVHMRIFSVFGPGDHPGSLINELIRKLPRKEEITLFDIEKLWNYIYIDDLVSAVLLLMFSPGAKGIYNIGTSDTRPLAEYIAEAAGIILGKDVSPSYLFAEAGISVGKGALKAEGSHDVSPDIGRICGLSFRTRYSFSEGLKETIGRIRKEESRAPHIRSGIL